MASLARSRTGGRLKACITDFSKAFDRVLHGLFYQTQRVKLEDYLSQSIQCQYGVPQGSHLGPISNIPHNGALDLFENVSVLEYADDLKLFITRKCIGDCQLFQRNPDRYPSSATCGPFSSYSRLMGRRSKGLIISKTLE
jgi:hypothetical protein